MAIKINEQLDLTHYDEVQVAIVSDTHTELDAKVKAVIETCDIVVHAGDIGSCDVMKLLHPKSGSIYAVSGNNDKPYLWDMSGWEFLKNLPEHIDLKLPGGLLSVEHGHLHDMNKPSHDSLRKAHPDSRAVIYGHTHHQVIDDSHKVMILNPGAAGSVRTHGGPSCLKLTASLDDWKIEPYRFTD